jgi:hypothetical protein
MEFLKHINSKKDPDFVGIFLFLYINKMTSQNEE